MGKKWYNGTKCFDREEARDEFFQQLSNLQYWRVCFQVLDEVINLIDILIVTYILYHFYQSGQDQKLGDFGAGSLALLALGQILSNMIGLTTISWLD